MIARGWTKEPNYPLGPDRSVVWYAAGGRTAEEVVHQVVAAAKADVPAPSEP